MCGLRWKPLRRPMAGLSRPKPRASSASLLARMTRGTSNPMWPTAQIEQFMTLNKLTPRGFYRAVAASGGWRILRFRLIETPRVERLLAYCPGLDRFTVWGIECVLRRDKQATLSARALSRWRWRQGLRKYTRTLLGEFSGTFSTTLRIQNCHLPPTFLVLPSVLPRRQTVVKQRLASQGRAWHGECCAIG